MSKHSTPMDQKIHKNWAEVMQQFELPTEKNSTAVSERNSCLATNKRRLSLSKTSKGLLAFSGTLLLAAGIYHNYHNTGAFSVDKLLAATTTTSNILKDISNTAPENEVKPQYLTLTKELPLASLETLSAGDELLDSSYLEEKNWKTYVVSPKEKLSKIFYRLDISNTQLEELKKIDSIKKELDKVTAGYILRAEKKDGKLVQLITYNPPAKTSFVISRQKDTYKGQLVQKTIETRQTRSTLFISHSLRYDANQENIPSSIVSKLVKIFDRDVKLTHDLDKGDRVTVVYEQIYHRGNKIADGDILAAELMHDKRVHRAIRFELADHKIDYFDDRGYDLSRSFKRFPLASFKRISSGFGIRRHPIYKRMRMHAGVDFAAPKGTPVYATSNGIVQHVARKGGYGKTIIIKHNGGYSTLYGHLNKYKKGLKPGMKVYLGDLIGYVGSTGSSTGSHLHYEFRVNGAPKDPLKVKLPKGLSLTSSERNKFKTNSRGLIRQLDVLQRFAEEKVDIKSGFGG